MSDSKHLPNGYQHRHGNIKVIELSEPEVRELWLMSTWYVDMLYDKHSLTDKSFPDEYSAPIKERVQVVETMLRRMVGLKWVDAGQRLDDFWNEALTRYKLNNETNETDTISNQE
jgi:hypothetical protein